ncbi:DegQ family serine endoprotease [Motiliproteus sp. MSK22-1]|uniref:DegQ family serine endoprotease n=1 Tax=Motiliproteus sp. MSK22-1 TaxID=1897630 RepID=UPI000977307E|nr:DegQ family serine endoprotease [Motiliproteus sp. MSK22-1]OMH38121.1 serine peptidase [Motiliproteus sp. MSK22-1]
MNRGYLWRSLGVFVALLLLARAVQASQLPDFTELVEEASPAIVNISTVQNGSKKGGSGRLPEGYDPEQLPEIFKHFFGERFGDQYRNPGPNSKRNAPKSLGSGFIISDDGYILTNNHVVKDADEILVRLSDRSEMEAELIGADPRSDLALLKVDAEGLPTVKLGNSDKLKSGEWVLAIGSPFGFDHTVTAGIVSATGRSLANENYVPFIQTDVAINPGNSGGPLFNLDGEVVGINSQIYTRSGGFMGLSFAIPITMAMEVVDQLKDKGHVARGWLGVYIQEVSKNLAESFGLDKPSGALVTRVTENSPAEDAGLKEGDIILRFNDQSVGFSSELPHLVGRVAPGTEVKLNILRDGHEESVDLLVGELPAQSELASRNKRQGSRENSLAVEVMPLEDERKAKWNITGGVVVRKVLPGPGADAGLLIGDVITSLNGQDIESVDSFERVVKELPKGKFIRMRIVRRGSSQYLPIKIES